jgi:hypothetical protein
MKARQTCVFEIVRTIVSNVTGATEAESRDCAMCYAEFFTAWDDDFYLPEALCGMTPYPVGSRGTQLKGGEPCVA